MKHKIHNVNDLHQLTIGQRIADKVASIMGSWPFVIIQSCILTLWILLNTVLIFIYHYDPYPFILLNLMLSFQAAYAAPFVMMSQNRQAAKDRIAADHDYQINLKGEEETRQILQHLEEHYRELLKQTTMLTHLLQQKGTNP